MAQAAVVAAFAARLSSWAQIGLCPIIDENTGGQVPADGSPYMVMQFPFSESVRASFGAPGNNIYREEGAARLVLHVQRGSGTEEARAWADSLASHFRGKHFDGVETFAPSSADSGNSNGLYFVVAIAVPYRFDITG
ncbi:phage tail terminator-like protein [Devosia sp. 63-57]|uniref:phage tail terminator-like protein n=1 Tax=Devosia sp. 63-57 TaxID=1895751 RepID=UPI00257CE9EF|nr:phage tail terminator-like protein [Devosia sp. 63-57]